MKRCFQYATNPMDVDEYLQRIPFRQDWLFAGQTEKRTIDFHSHQPENLILQYFEAFCKK